MKVREVNMTDGVKLVFDSSTWLLFPPLRHRAGGAHLRRGLQPEGSQAGAGCGETVRRAGRGCGILSE